MNENYNKESILQKLFHLLCVLCLAVDLFRMRGFLEARSKEEDMTGSLSRTQVALFSICQKI